MTLYDHQIRDRKEYPDVGGKSVITVGEKQGRFVVFEIQEYNHDNTEIKQHRTVEIRYVGDVRPESALQVDVQFWGHERTRQPDYAVPAVSPSV